MSFQIQAGLLGYPLTHSFSPQIHRLLGNYPYTLKEIPPNRLDEFMHRNDLSAFNITIPYKTKVLPYIDVISDSAKEIGAVNTIVKKNGLIYGYNTDVEGFIRSFRSVQSDMENQNVLISGTGGAAKAVAYASRKLNAKSICMVSRSGDINYENVYQVCPQTDILINATPVGMYPHINESVIDITRFSHLSIVMDLIYNPLKTRLLSNAQSAGIKTLNGLSMLVQQAALSSELFGNGSVSGDIIQNIIKTLETQSRNIVLVGMPSCGKSTLGKALSEHLSLKCTDTDKEIEKEIGLTIPQIFNQYGEAYFRKSETATIRKYAKEHNQVIAVGGGALTVAENAYLLKSNGFILWLQRDLSLLTPNGRPLSQKTPMDALYQQRAPQYAMWADKIIDNNGSIQNTLNQILKEVTV